MVGIMLDEMLRNPQYFSPMDNQTVRNAQDKYHICVLQDILGELDKEKPIHIGPIALSKDHVAYTHIKSKLYEIIKGDIFIIKTFNKNQQEVSKSRRVFPRVLPTERREKAE